MIAIAIGLFILLVVRELQSARERALAARERRDLYQRLQAPEIAVREAVKETRERRPARHLSIDDDKAFVELNEQRKAAGNGSA